jgi:hypothetical protein
MSSPLISMKGHIVTVKNFSKLNQTIKETPGKPVWILKEAFREWYINVYDTTKNEICREIIFENCHITKETGKLLSPWLRRLDKISKFRFEKCEIEDLEICVQERGSRMGIEEMTVGDIISRSFAIGFFGVPDSKTICSTLANAVISVYKSTIDHLTVKCNFEPNKEHEIPLCLDVNSSTFKSIDFKSDLYSNFTPSKLSVIKRSLLGLQFFREVLKDMIMTHVLCEINNEPSGFCELCFSAEASELMKQTNVNEYLKALDLYRRRKPTKIVSLETTERLVLTNFQRQKYLQELTIINYELIDMKNKALHKYFETNKDLAEMNLVKLIKEF